jgi:hypothetical protein
MRFEGGQVLTRIFQVLLRAGLAIGMLWTANDPFVGQWKLDPSRSKLADEMKVTKVGQNKYTFDLGGGQPETIVVDGTDQAGLAGTTLSVAPEGLNWKVIRKKDGRMFITATWTLSKDGRSLTDDFTSTSQDGSTSNVKYVYRRTAGGKSGFAGTWVSTSEVVNSVFTIQITPYENSGLSFVFPGVTTNVTFDGKSARRLNASAVEIIHKSEGKITQTQHFELSPDLKTLTLTTRTMGRTAPNILVFERQ